MTTSVDDRTEAVPGDLRMVRRLWPFLVAAFGATTASAVLLAARLDPRRPTVRVQ